MRKFDSFFFNLYRSVFYISVFAPVSVYSCVCLFASVRVRIFTCFWGTCVKYVDLSSFANLSPPHNHLCIYDVDGEAKKQFLRDETKAWVTEQKCLSRKATSAQWKQDWNRHKERLFRKTVVDVCQRQICSCWRRLRILQTPTSPMSQAFF